MQPKIPMKPDHLTLQEAAHRSSLSVSFLRRHLRNPPCLPHLRAGRKILIGKDELVRWLENFRDTGADESNARQAQFRKDFPH